MYVGNRNLQSTITLPCQVVAGKEDDDPNNLLESAFETLDAYNNNQLGPLRRFRKYARSVRSGWDTIGQPQT